LPDEELSSFERIFFQLEQAWWQYEDFYREENSKLPKFDLKSFCTRFFTLVPALRAFKANFETHFAKFRDYIAQVLVHSFADQLFSFL
jgi:mRNA-decapping enzyme subunit 2